MIFQQEGNSLCLGLDNAFRFYGPSRKRDLFIGIRKIVSVNEDLILVSIKTNSQSLAEIVEFDSAQSVQRSQMMAMRIGDDTLDKSSILSEMQSQFSPKLLHNWLYPMNEDCLSMIAKRRFFATQLGTLAVFQLLTNSLSPSPDQLIITHSGEVSFLGMSPCLSLEKLDILKKNLLSQINIDGTMTMGCIETPASGSPPLRLTRQILEALSGTLVLGALGLTLGIGVDAIVDSVSSIQVGVSLLVVYCPAYHHLSTVGFAVLLCTIFEPL